MMLLCPLSVSVQAVTSSSLGRRPEATSRLLYCVASKTVGMPPNSPSPSCSTRETSPWRGVGALTTCGREVSSSVHVLRQLGAYAASERGCEALVAQTDTEDRKDVAKLLDQSRRPGEVGRVVRRSRARAEDDTGHGR